MAAIEGAAGAEKGLSSRLSTFTGEDFEDLGHNF